MLNKNSVQKLTYMALCTALVFLGTFIIKIPSLGAGYVHPGDAFVCLSGILFGPYIGFFSSAMGSLLADMVGGYFNFAIATFFIKGIEALLCYYLFNLLRRSVRPQFALIISSLGGGLFMILSYCLYESFLFGFGKGVLGIPGNIGQAVTAVILSLLLYPILKRIIQPNISL